MTDARATAIYAAAHNQSPSSVEFYEFTRTLQANKSIFAENTIMTLSAGSGIFNFLKNMNPNDGIIIDSPVDDGTKSPRPLAGPK